MVTRGSLLLDDFFGLLDFLRPPLPVLRSRLNSPCRLGDTAVTVLPPDTPLPLLLLIHVRLRPEWWRVFSSAFPRQHAGKARVGSCYSWEVPPPPPRNWKGRETCERPCVCLALLYCWHLLVWELVRLTRVQVGSGTVSDGRGPAGKAGTPSLAVTRRDAAAAWRRTCSISHPAAATLTRQERDAGSGQSGESAVLLLLVTRDSSLWEATATREGPSGSWPAVSHVHWGHLPWSPAPQCGVYVAVDLRIVGVSSS